MGLNEESLNQIISIYPNPVSDELHINTKDLIHIKKLSVYNVLGKKVVEINRPKNTISLGRLDFGVHLLIIDTDQGSLQKTILKK